MRSRIAAPFHLLRFGGGQDLAIQPAAGSGTPLHQPLRELRQHLNRTRKAGLARAGVRRSAPARRELESRRVAISLIFRR
jgi:hypothetical protein